MIIQPPLITTYYRIIDNVTGKELQEYRFLDKKSSITYGTLSSLNGGESEFVVEFDIWNNEPAFYGGIYTADVQNATQCNFTAWDNEKMNSTYSIRNLIDNKSYVMARCINRDFPTFKHVAGNINIGNVNLYSSVLENPGELSGQHGGDHFKIQTKISIPPNNSVGVGLKNFIFEFSYNYV